MLFGSLKTVRSVGPICSATRGRIIPTQGFSPLKEPQACFWFFKQALRPLRPSRKLQVKHQARRCARSKYRMAKFQKCCCCCCACWLFISLAAWGRGNYACLSMLKETAQNKFLAGHLLQQRIAWPSSSISSESCQAWLQQHGCR